MRAAPKPGPVCARCGGPLVWKPRPNDTPAGFHWQWVCERCRVPDFSERAADHLVWLKREGVSEEMRLTTAMVAGAILRVLRVEHGSNDPALITEALLIEASRPPWRGGDRLPTEQFLAVASFIRWRVARRREVSRV